MSLQGHALSFIRAQICSHSGDPIQWQLNKPFKGRKTCVCGQITSMAKEDGKALSVPNAMVEQ